MAAKKAGLGRYAASQKEILFKDCVTCLVMLANGYKTSIMRTTTVLPRTGVLGVVQFHILAGASEEVAALTGEFILTTISDQLADARCSMPGGAEKCEEDKASCPGCVALHDKWLRCILSLEVDPCNEVSACSSQISDLVDCKNDRECIW